MLYERYMFKDLNNYIEQISYFGSKTILGNIKNNVIEGYLFIEEDVLWLIEHFCNCHHVHDDILNEISEEIQRNVWFNGYGISINIVSDGFSWKLNNY